ncbi:MAG: DUF805 domain-containing protein [Methylococcaceae bacterium]
MNWYLEVFKKYAVFSGRAGRQEYWYFTLFNILVGILLRVMDQITGNLDYETGLGLLSTFYSLVVLIPATAVLVRRLHDTDRSAWWLLIALVPLIGELVLLVFTLQDSQPGNNQYGANPKDNAD